MTILKTSGSWSYLWEKRYPFNFNNRERSLPSPPHPPETEISCTCRSTITNQSKQRIKFQKVPVDLIASRPVRKQPENFHYPTPSPPDREDQWGVQHESAKTQLMLQKICLRVFTWPFTRQTKPLKQSDGQNQRQRQFISRHICWNSLLKLNTPRQFSSKDFETEVNDSKEGILIYLYIVCPAKLLNILNQYICGKIGKKHFHKKSLTPY